MTDLLVESGKDTGRKEMIPVVGVAIGVGALSYAVIQKLVKYFKKKEEISPDAVQSAREELIQGIKDYDAAHPEGDEKESDDASAVEEELKE